MTTDLLIRLASAFGAGVGLGGATGAGICARRHGDFPPSWTEIIGDYAIPGLILGGSAGLIVVLIVGGLIEWLL